MLSNCSPHPQLVTSAEVCAFEREGQRQDGSENKSKTFITLNT